MQTNERTIRVIRPPDVYRAKAAAAQITAKWIPSQPTLHRSIRERLKRGDYTENRKELYRDLSRDPATLFQFLKALPAVTGGEPPLKPSAKLETLSDGTIGELLNRSLAHRSAHRLGNGTPLQRRETIRAILSSAAARATGHRFGEFIDLGIVSLLRNLGRLLIGWENPRMLERVRQAGARRRTEIAAHVEGEAGLSPTALAFSVAREWELHPEYLRLIVLDPSVEPESPARDVARLCDAVEMYVENEFLAGPASVSRDEREKSRAELADAAGEDCELLLQEVAHEELERVKRWYVSPQDGGVKSPHAAETPHPAASNRAFKLLMEQQDEDGLTALRRIFEAVVPALGFSGGCLYMLDGAHVNLVPVFATAQAKPHRTVDIRRTGVISASLFAPHPIVQEPGMLEGELRSHITGAAAVLGREAVLSLYWAQREQLTDEPAKLFSDITGCLSYLSRGAQPTHRH